MAAQARRHQRTYRTINQARVLVLTGPDDLRACFTRRPGVGAPRPGEAVVEQRGCIIGLH